MEIKQIDDNTMRNLIKDIEQGNVRLVLLDGNEKIPFITESEKRERFADILEMYKRAIPIYVKTLIGNIATIASPKEKIEIIHQEIEELNKEKTIMFDTNYQTDDIRALQNDFCEVINSITNKSYNFEGNIYDEEIDEIINSEDKCKVKK